MLKRNSIHIEENELAAWYAATGFYLPRTLGELRRFDKLYNDFDFHLNGNELDPNLIFEGISQVHSEIKAREIDVEIEPLRMAARGLNEIPSLVRQKMVKNQKIIQDEVK